MCPPSTNPPAPWRKPPYPNPIQPTLGAHALPAPGTSRVCRPQALTMAGLKTGFRGVPKPRPQPGSGITSCPAFSLGKWGSSERSSSERREEKENVRLPVSHGFRHQQARAIAPPCRMSPGHCGNAQLCHPPASRGWPGPAPNPKLLPGAGLGPTEAQKIVWHVGSVGAGEGSPFFPNLFLADRDSLLCSGWVRQAIGCGVGWHSATLGAWQGTAAPGGLARKSIFLGTRVRVWLLPDPAAHDTSGQVRQV